MGVAKFSQIGFILAAAGSAVGLGNVWKFPYMTGENGGGAFVLVYLLTITFIGLSIFIAEVLMGRLSEGDTVSAFEKLAPSHGDLWKYAGFMIFSGILIISFYMIVIGWIFKYVLIAATSLPVSVKEAGGLFGGMVTTDVTNQFLYFTITFIIVFFIVAKGVKEGIEKINVWLMPMLIIILVLMLAYSMTMSGFKEALSFLFVPDWSKINASSILAAVGQAFFTLSLGVGTIMTYAASLPKDTNIVKSSAIVAMMDTVIALVSGVIIFTFIFHFNAEPSQGPGLVFISLPTLFHQLGVTGNVLGVMFFVALAFAGVTSAVSMIEPTAYYMINRFNISRIKALLIIAVVVYALGSLALISNIEDLKAHVTFFGKGFFDILDFLSSSIMMPLGGIMIAIFVGFFVKRDLVHDVLSPYVGESFFNLWYFSLKYIAPLGVLAIMFNQWFGS